jgi:formylglycine-generating enzyme required for sulfatase activity
MAQPVFISYSSADTAVAGRICAALESAGISCWIAPRDIEPGTDYPAAIVDAVTSCSVLIVLLTENALSSPHILSEVGHAFNRKKRIIPFRLARVPLSKDMDYFLSMAQWLEAPEGCTDQNLDRLKEATLAALHGETPPVTNGNKGSHARLWRVALISGLAVVAGTIAYRAWPPHSLNPPVGKSDDKIAHSVQQTWLNPKDGQQYSWIPAGTFTMGCSPADSQCADDEKPAHPVDIQRGFWLARTEVTVAAYQKFAASHKLPAPTGDGNLPYANLTWAEAKRYCASVGGRLPTEAEWEYAARGGESGAYYGPVPAIAWFAENSSGAPHIVGTKEPNAYGLYDMLGNVSEWVLDRYYNRYDVTSPAVGANVEQPLVSNAETVARGGFWDSDAASIRVSHRAAHENDDAQPMVGVRCANDRQ